MTPTMTPLEIADRLCEDLAALRFAKPVCRVYNPLIYARAPYAEYLRRYGERPKEVLLLGMNPGPWGMAQTGVPFGDVAMVRNWLGIEAPVGRPAHPHPGRPVEGFACQRREVSGQRLWGWARNNFVTPDNFFARFLVINYCPLLFIEESGRNRTPNQLPAAERRPLLAACDAALARIAVWYKPRYLIGIGRFAESRLRQVCGQPGITIGFIPHPSPASPAANRNWPALMDKFLSDLGIII